jgi:hypothetical protein
MAKIKKIYGVAKEFPKHIFPLVFSFPPHMSYDESRDVLVDYNLFIVKNKCGFTSVYSIGQFEEQDIKEYFQKLAKILKS